MNNERMLYISPEDDLPSICTRLEHAHSRHVILVMPIHASHLHAFGTWRMLHAYTRRRGIRVHIVSANPYFRSIAHSARFTVSKTLEVPSHERPLRIRPSTHKTSPEPFIEDVNVGENVHLLYLADDEHSASPVQHLPHAQPTFSPSTLMFTDDDVLPIPPHPDEPPVRVAKPPQPLNMPRMRRTRPLTPPPLPWDDVDNELLSPQPLHKPRRRRTNPLVQSMMRRRGITRTPHRRISEGVVSLTPILCIGIFIVVRSIVQYMRKRAS